MQLQKDLHKQSEHHNDVYYNQFETTYKGLVISRRGELCASAAEDSHYQPRPLVHRGVIKSQ